MMHIFGTHAHRHSFSHIHVYIIAYTRVCMCVCSRVGGTHLPMTTNHGRLQGLMVHDLGVSVYSRDHNHEPWPADALVPSPGPTALHRAKKNALAPSPTNCPACQNVRTKTRNPKKIYDLYIHHTVHETRQAMQAHRTHSQHRNLFSFNKTLNPEP
jgi:hypothetical protein